MSSSKMPTHRLSVKDQDTGASAEVGAAWLNEDGSLNVKLNPCVVLSYDNLKGKFLMVFPVTAAEAPRTAAGKAVAEMRARAAKTSGTE